MTPPEKIERSEEKEINKYISALKPGDFNVPETEVKKDQKLKNIIEDIFDKSGKKPPKTLIDRLLLSYEIGKVNIDELQPTHYKVENGVLQFIKKSGDKSEVIKSIDILPWIYEKRYDLGKYTGAAKKDGFNRVQGSVDATPHLVLNRSEKWYESKVAAANLLLDVYDNNKARLTPQTVQLILSKEKVLRNLAAQTDFNPNNFTTNFEKKNTLGDVFGTHGVYNIVLAFQRVLDLSENQIEFIKERKSIISLVIGPDMDKEEERYVRIGGLTNAPDSTGAPKSAPAQKDKKPGVILKDELGPPLKQPDTTTGVTDEPATNPPAANADKKPDENAGQNPNANPAEVIIHAPKKRAADLNLYGKNVNAPVLPSSEKFAEALSPDVASDMLIDAYKTNGVEAFIAGLQTIYNKNPENADNSFQKVFDKLYASDRQLGLKLMAEISKGSGSQLKASIDKKIKDAIDAEPNEENKKVLELTKLLNDITFSSDNMDKEDDEKHSNGMRLIVEKIASINPDLLTGDYKEFFDTVSKSVDTKLRTSIALDIVETTKNGLEQSLLDKTKKDTYFVKSVEELRNLSREDLGKALRNEGVGEWADTDAEVYLASQHVLEAMRLYLTYLYPLEVMKGTEIKNPLRWARDQVLAGTEIQLPDGFQAEPGIDVIHDVYTGKTEPVTGPVIDVGKLFIDKTKEVDLFDQYEQGDERIGEVSIWNLAPTSVTEGAKTGAIMTGAATFGVGAIPGAIVGAGYGAIGKYTGAGEKLKADKRSFVAGKGDSLMESSDELFSTGINGLMSEKGTLGAVEKMELAKIAYLRQTRNYDEARALATRILADKLPKPSKAELDKKAKELTSDYDSKIRAQVRLMMEKDPRFANVPHAQLEQEISKATVEAIEDKAYLTVLGESAAKFDATKLTDFEKQAQSLLNAMNGVGGSLVKDETMDIAITVAKTVVEIAAIELATAGMGSLVAGMVGAERVVQVGATGLSIARGTGMTLRAYRAGEAVAGGVRAVVGTGRLARVGGVGVRGMRWMVESPNIAAKGGRLLTHAALFSEGQQLMHGKSLGLNKESAYDVASTALTMAVLGGATKFMRGELGGMPTSGLVRGPQGVAEGAIATSAFTSRGLNYISKGSLATGKFVAEHRVIGGLATMGVEFGALSMVGELEKRGRVWTGLNSKTEMEAMEDPIWWHNAVHTAGVVIGLRAWGSAKDRLAKTGKIDVDPLLNSKNTANAPKKYADVAADFTKLADAIKNKTAILDKTVAEWLLKLPERLKQLKDSENISDADYQTKIAEINKDLADLFGSGATSEVMKDQNVRASIIDHLANNPGQGVPAARELIKRGALKFGELPDVLKEGLRNSAISRIQTLVQKSKSGIDQDITDVEAKITRDRADGKNVDELETKLRKLKIVKEANEQSLLKDADTIGREIDAVLGLDNPQAYSDMPSLGEILLTNAESLSPEYLNSILANKAYFTELQVGTNLEKFVCIPGTNDFGKGTYGGLSNVLIIDAAGRAREVARKQSLMPINLFALRTGTSAANEEIGHFLDKQVSHLRRDPALRDKVVNTIKQYTTTSLEHPTGLEDTIRTLKEDVLNGDTLALNEIIPYLARIQNLHAESTIAGRIGSLQAKGKLKGFVRVTGADVDGNIYMENLQNPNIGGRVSDLDSVIEGRVVSIDGQNPVSSRQIVLGLADACESLTELHENNLVHRDVKPSNIVFTADGKMKIIDFGSVKSKAEMRQISYDTVKASDDPYSADSRAQQGETEYSYPSRRDVSPRYFSSEVAVKESSGELPLGSSDRVSMGYVISDVLEARRAQFTPEQQTKINDLAESMKRPKGPTLKKAAEALRKIMK